MDHLDPYPSILSGRDEELPNLVGDEQQSAAPNPRRGRAWIRGIRDYSAILHLMYTATLITIYVPIISLVQLKFQNQEKSPFETSGFFMILSIVALCIATTTSGVLFYIHHRLENSTEYNFSLPLYMVLKGVFMFFGILTPVSLILVLLVPHNLDWVRYLIICVLIGAVAICSFHRYLKLYDMEEEVNIEDKVNMEAHQMA